MEKSLREDSHEYLMYQIEKGANGTEHIQALIYYKNPRVWPKKKYPSAHIEIARDVAAAIKYCSKEESRVRGPYEFGSKPRQGTRTDLQELAQKVIEGKSMLEIAESDPAQFVRYHKGLQVLANEVKKHRHDKPDVVWLWGLTGVGKTAYAIRKHGRANCYIKDSTKWWDGYTGQDVIIVDDFDGQWPYRNFLRFLDENDYSGEVKGGWQKITARYIYITCEYRPHHYWMKENEINQVLRRIEKIIEVQRPEKPAIMPKEEVYVVED